jgi:hypothetical protein
MARVAADDSGLLLRSTAAPLALSGSTGTEPVLPLLLAVKKVSAGLRGLRLLP